MRNIELREIEREMGGGCLENEEGNSIQYSVCNSFSLGGGESVGVFFPFLLLLPQKTGWV